MEISFTAPSLAAVSVSIYGRSMAGKLSRRRLEERRTNILKLIESLQEELSVLEATLRATSQSSGVVLGQEFFWRQIAPLLIPGKALTGLELTSLLRKSNLLVDASRFRVLLTRMRKKGLLAYEQGHRGVARWALTEIAVSEYAKQRK